MIKEKDNFVVIDGPDSVSDSVMNLYRIAFDFFQEGVEVSFTSGFTEGKSRVRPYPGPSFSFLIEESLVNHPEFLAALKEIAAVLGKDALKNMD